MKFCYQILLGHVLNPKLLLEVEKFSQKHESTGLLKVLFIFRCSKIGKKSEGNHMLTNDCPHFFLPILRQQKMKNTLANITLHVPS